MWTAVGVLMIVAAAGFSAWGALAWLDRMAGREMSDYHGEG